MNFSIGKFFYEKLIECDHYKNSPYIHSSDYFTLEESYEIYQNIANKLVYKINGFYHIDTTIDFIKYKFDHISFTIDWPRLCLFTHNITEKDILDNLDYPWSIIDLAKNENFSAQFIKKIISLKNTQIPDILRYNKFAKLNDFDYLTFDLCLYLCFYSINITIKDFEFMCRKFPQKFHEKLYMKYSNNFNLTYDYIAENLSKPWNWDGLTMNTSINIYEILDSKFTHMWKYEKLHLRPDFTIHLAKKYTIPLKKFLHSPFLTAHDLISNNLTLLNSKSSFAYYNCMNWTIFDLEKYIYIFKDSKDTFDDTFYYNLLLNGSSLVNLNNTKQIKFIQQKKKQVNVYYHELMAKTWHPNRLHEWIWSEEEKKEWLNTFE